MLKARIMPRLMMLLMIMERVWIKAVMGEVYNVGGSDGWTILSNSSYIAWKSSKRFHVGDTLLFHYNPTNHNVMQVDLSGFRSCNMTKPLKIYQSGNDWFTIQARGHYFFICSFPGHCEAGQKLDVRVPRKYSQMTTPHTNVTSTNTTATPKASAKAPSSVASLATDQNCLVRSIGYVFVFCVAMLVA